MDPISSFLQLVDWLSQSKAVLEIVKFESTVVGCPARKHICGFHGLIALSSGVRKSGDVGAGGLVQGLYLHLGRLQDLMRYIFYSFLRNGGEGYTPLHRVIQRRAALKIALSADGLDIKRPGVIPVVVMLGLATAISAREVCRSLKCSRGNSSRDGFMGGLLRGLANLLSMHFFAGIAFEDLPTFFKVSRFTNETCKSLQHLRHRLFRAPHRIPIRRRTQEIDRNSSGNHHIRRFVRRYIPGLQPVLNMLSYDRASDGLRQLCRTVLELFKGQFDASFLSHVHAFLQIRLQYKCKYICAQVAQNNLL